jgi:hypothetical protein
MFSARRGQDLHRDRFEPPVTVDHTPSSLPRDIPSGQERRSTVVCYQNTLLPCTLCSLWLLLIFFYPLRTKYCTYSDFSSDVYICKPILTAVDDEMMCHFLVARNESCANVNSSRHPAINHLFLKSPQAFVRQTSKIVCYDNKKAISTVGLWSSGL